MRASALALTGILCAQPLLASAAPAELLNKTITVSYTVSIPGKGEDGSLVPGIRNATRTIYISSKGRIFSRVTRQDGRMSATKEFAPGDATNTMRFEGARLVGVMPFVSGASQMSVSFQGGQGCAASFTIGRENGRVLSWKGVNGKTYVAVGPPSVSNVSCSISAGNAFAGQ